LHHLPTGTVTFLFTDIEDSTTLVHRLGEAYRDVLEDHNRLLREAFASGVEVRMEGDAFLVVFAAATQALAAAVAGQRLLADHRWPAGGRVAVRMGLHTGEGRLGGADYVGTDVHLGARVAAAGHGGQILASAATRESAVPQNGVSLRDLGAHRFKGFVDPIRVFQVVTGDLPADFAPIRSVGVPPHNLPTQSSDFIGRATEMEALFELVQTGRIVTLTGPGGIGKTRLALHVASRLLHRFTDGVFLVPLDAISEPHLVAPAIIQHLGVSAQAGREPVDVLVDHLADKHLLLVLDNLEQIVEAAPMVSMLSARAPGLAVLATSQTLLRVRGEVAYPVPPLGLPDLSTGAADLGDAVALFAQRVRAADPSFVIRPEDTATIAAIVSELDGLPLAIELAAARVRLFGLEGLRSRLRDRFHALGVGARDAPERHRTLRQAIQWSYGLLDDRDQEVLAHLGVFSGGFTLEGAEAVVPARLDPVEAVASLLDKSLLRSSPGGWDLRFSMLRSIRDFARERLTAREDRDAVTGRFVDHLVVLAETAAPHLDAADQALWLDRLAADHDNIRAALDWCIATGATDAGLRLAGSTWRFSHRRGHLREGRDRLVTLLSMPGASPRARAIGLSGLAGIHYWRSEFAAARTRYEEALDLYRRLGDTEGTAATLFGLSTTAALMGDVDAALDLAQRSEEAYVAAGSPGGARRVAAAAAFASWLDGRLEVADEAFRRVEESFREAAEGADELQTCVARASIAFQLGRTVEAVTRIHECLEGMVATGDVTGTVMALEHLAAMTAAERPEAAVRLGAGAARHREEGGGHRPEAVGLQSVRSATARVLSPGRLDELWAEGEAMSLAELVEYARSLAPSSR
jgi:predicted ATPase/class 3 adenylate cyclase